MIYYFLPGSGIYGGVKVGGQFVDLLNSLGVPSVLVFEDGIAPDWFPMSSPIVSGREATQHFNENDWAMFSYPGDYSRMKALAKKNACHCQGTHASIDPICADPDVLFMTCWREAFEYVRNNFCRTPVEVGISIGDSFFFDGSRKFDNLVAYMPRRGFRISRDCIRHNKNLDFVAIDAMCEKDVSVTMKQAGVFLATSEGEFFGLPALEAMAAGCLVLTVPVKGGIEYLRDGENCLVVEARSMPDKLSWIMHEENLNLRSAIRTRAISTAFGYRKTLQRRRLADLLNSELRVLVS